MIYKEVVAHIARRLPHQEQRDVREVIDLLIELWSDELATGNEILLPTIGKLTIEIQDIKTGGVLAHEGNLKRIYGRFRLTPTFKRKVKENTIE